MKKIIDDYIKIWIAIAKNNDIQIFKNYPTKGKTSWIGEFYINSIVYENIKELIKNSSLDWNSEPEYLELSFVQN